MLVLVLGLAIVIVLVLLLGLWNRLRLQAFDPAPWHRYDSLQKLLAFVGCAGSAVFQCSFEQLAHPATELDGQTVHVKLFVIESQEPCVGRFVDPVAI